VGGVLLLATCLPGLVGGDPGGSECGSERKLLFACLAPFFLPCLWRRGREDAAEDWATACFHGSRKPLPVGKTPRSAWRRLAQKHYFFVRVSGSLL